jgi:hypothetical protein
MGEIPLRFLTFSGHHADNNLNIGTVQVADQTTFYRDSKNGYSINTTTDVGSNINGVGNGNAP